MKRRKILQKILGGTKNIRFADMVSLVVGFGFTRSRTDGSNYIYSRSDILEIVNLQDVKGQAKPYQMRQFLKLVEKHNLKLEDEYRETIILTFSIQMKTTGTYLILRCAPHSVILLMRHCVRFKRQKSYG